MKSSEEGKNGSSQHSRRLKWDEEIIAEHDKERGTRQKILEPPTPYAYNSDADEDEANEIKEDENGNGVEGLSAPKLEHQMEELNAKLEYQRHLQMEGTGFSAPHTSSSSEITVPDGELEKPKKSFKDLRNNHYNEFKVLQALRSRNMDLDDEDDFEGNHEKEGNNDSSRPMDTAK